MNFPQLIDPEWVQQGCPRRSPLVKIAQMGGGAVTQPPSPPKAPPAHTGEKRDPKSITSRMLRCLADARKALTVHELAYKAGLTDRPGSVNGILYQLLTAGEVERTNERKPYAYTITDYGRGRL